MKEWNKIKFGKKDKYVDKVIKYIGRALELMTPTDGGFRISILGAPNYDDILYVLGDLITIKEFLGNSRLKRIIIRKTLVRLKKYKRLSPYYIKKAIDIEKKKIFEGSPKKYFVVFQFIVDPNGFHRKQITIDGITFKLKKKADFFRTFTPPDHNYRIIHPRVFESFLKEYLILYTKYEGTNIDSVFYDVNSSFEILRGLLNLSLKYGRSTYNIGGGFGPHSAVISPRFYLIYTARKQFLESFFNTGSYISPSRIFDKKRIAWFFSLVRYYNRKKENELKNIFKNSIKIYVDSLESNDAKISFFGLWQVLEFIALKDIQNISERKVCQRIKSLLDPKAKIEQELINILYKKRNKIAHEFLNVEITEEDLNPLLSIVQSALLFVFDNINVIETKEKLNYFYENISPNTKTKNLEEKKAMINYVMKIKS